MVRKITLLAAAAFLVSSAAPGVFVAGTARASTESSTTGFRATPGVLPPQARLMGATYGQWSATWWQWALGTPVHTGTTVTHPLLATGAVDCTIGQTGKVWFLGGNFNGQPGNVLSRTCTVPTGTFFFTPIFNGWIDNSNCDGSLPTNFTTDQLRAMVRDSVNSATTLSASLDGRAVNDIGSPTSPYRATSPVFSYTTPADSLINDLFCPFHPQTVTGAVADGVYMMLTPLAPGPHIVHWTVFSGSTLVMDVVYHLTAR
jgi:hypothetical protein